jgi:hypothetical protein
MLEAELTPGSIVLLEELGQFKNPITISGIELATYRLGEDQIFVNYSNKSKLAYNHQNIMSMLISVTVPYHSAEDI